MRAFAILPAAGRSRRMGEPKLLLPWGNTTLIQHVVNNWRASRVEQVIVVLHPDDAQIAQQCHGAYTAVCTPPPAEMKDSICHGIGIAEQVFHAGPGDAWLVAPADMPGISTDVINALIGAYEHGTNDRETPPRIWTVRHQGRRGHPVLFPWSLAGEVAKLGDSEGLKALLARHPVEYVDVDTDAIFADIDTPAEYRRHRPHD